MDVLANISRRARLNWQPCATELASGHREADFRDQFALAEAATPWLFIKLLAQGKGNKFIALAFSLSTRSIEGYRHRIMHKMSFGSLNDLVCFAARQVPIIEVGRVSRLRF